MGIRRVHLCESLTVLSSTRHPCRSWEDRERRRHELGSASSARGGISDSGANFPGDSGTAGPFPAPPSSPHLSEKPGPCETLGSLPVLASDGPETADFITNLTSSISKKEVSIPPQDCPVQLPGLGQHGAGPERAATIRQPGQCPTAAWLPGVLCEGRGPCSGRFPEGALGVQRGAQALRTQGPPGDGGAVGSEWAVQGPRNVGPWHTVRGSSQPHRGVPALWGQTWAQRPRLHPRTRSQDQWRGCDRGAPGAPDRFPGVPPQAALAKRQERRLQRQRQQTCPADLPAAPPLPAPGLRPGFQTL